MTGPKLIQSVVNNLKRANLELALDVNSKEDRDRITRMIIRFAHSDRQPLNVYRILKYDKGLPYTENNDEIIKSYKQLLQLKAVRRGSITVYFNSNWHNVTASELNLVMFKPARTTNPLRVKNLVKISDMFIKVFFKQITD